MNAFSEKFAECVDKTIGTPSLTNHSYSYDKSCRGLARDLDSVLSCIIESSNGNKICENPDIKKLIDRGKNICDQDSKLLNILKTHRSRRSSSNIISDTTLRNWTISTLPSKLAPEVPGITPDDKVKYCKFVLRILAGLLKLTEEEECELLNAYDVARGCAPEVPLPSPVFVQPQQLLNVQEGTKTPDIPTVPPTPSQSLRKKYALFTMVAMVLTIWFSSLMLSRSQGNQEFSIKILYPPTNMRCPHEVLVYGIVKNLPSSKQLWIIKEPNKGIYHPDRGPLRVKENGEFFGGAYIGNAALGADNEKIYTVHLVVTSYESGRRFNDYLTEAHKTGGWHGLPSILDGKIVSSFNVIRDDSMKCQYENADEFV